MKIIAVDYDDTFTADPDLFAAFMQAAQARGHMVVCVTFRNEETHPITDLQGIEIFYTNGRKKAAFMLEQGLPVSIWIDDRPDLIGDLKEEILIQSQ